MKLAFSLARIGTLFLVSLLSFAVYADINIAIFDSPVDYGHESLATYAAIEEMKAAQIIDSTTGKKASLWDINQHFFLRFDQGMAAEVRRLARANKLGEFAISSASEEERRSAVQILRREVQRPFKIDKAYIHGTHVAAILTEGLRGVRVFNFVPSVPSLDRGLTALEVLSRFRITSQLNVESITRVFDKHQIRVVNLSIAFELGLFEQVLADAHKAGVLTERDRQVINKSVLRDLFFEQMIALIERNPQTVFVFAAGNSTKNMDIDVVEMTRLKKSNSIFVAALDSDSKIAKFSNSGRRIVEIAASGTDIVSAAAGTSNGRIALSGTSMAAPAVARRLTEIFLEDPTRTVEQAIHHLLTQHTYENSHVMGEVSGGRTLLDRAIQVAQVRPIIRCREVHLRVVGR